MNGLMTKYKESLLKTPKPIPFSAIKGSMDYRGLWRMRSLRAKRCQNLPKKKRRNFITNKSVELRRRDWPLRLRGDGQGFRVVRSAP